MAHTIRVHNYAGDWDSLAELHIIGPYATAQDRDRDLDRLARIPDEGFFQVEASRVDPGSADRSCVPSAVAAAASWQDVLDAFY